MPTFLGPFSADDFPNWQEAFMKKVNYLSTTIDPSTNSGPVAMGDFLLAGSVVIQIFLVVETAFDAAPQLTIGTNQNTSEYFDMLGLDFAEPGVYHSFIFSELLTTTAVNAYWNPAGASTGKMKIIMIFTDP